MNRTSRIAGLGLVIGIVGAGCGTAGPDAEPTTNGLPALTAEEQAVVETMARNTLAEIDLPEGRMQFIEAAPGEVLVVREFPVGAKLTRVEGENAMTLDQLFHAYDPNRKIPHTLLDAAARVAGTSPVAEARPTTIAATPGMSAQSPIAHTIAPAPDGVERVGSALASTIDVNWFTANFCNVSGADYTFCFAAAWTGAWAKKRSHRTGSIACGDTGSGRSNFTRDGSVLAVRDIGYGQCQLISGYHGPHGAFGVNLERDLRHNIVGASDTVRFAGWFADEDQFLGNAY